MERFKGAIKTGTTSIKLGASKTYYYLLCIITGPLWLLDKITLIISKAGFFIFAALIFTVLVPKLNSNGLTDAIKDFFMTTTWRTPEGLKILIGTLIISLAAWFVFRGVYRLIHNFYESTDAYRIAVGRDCNVYVSDIERYYKIASGDMTDEYNRMCDEYRKKNVNYQSILD